MQRLSNTILLVCGELNFDELHLQRGLLGACWRHVHGMCRRKVETRGSWQLQRLSYKRILTQR